MCGSFLRRLLRRLTDESGRRVDDAARGVLMNVTLLRAEVRAVRRWALRLTHHGLSMVGLLALAGVAWIVAHPEYTQTLGRWMSGPDKPQAPAAALVPATPDPFAGAIAKPTGEVGRILGLASSDTEDLADAPVVMQGSAHGASSGSEKDRRSLVKYLARKYRVNNDALSLLVDAAYVTGRDLHMDPTLLLSVMAVESGFNPFAESTAGASGLMQLMSKVHSDKFNDYGGANIALNPVANLRVGALVLKDCIQRGGSVAEGLRLYVGAGNGADNGYGACVLQEKDRMLQAVRGMVERPRIRAIPEREARPEADTVKPADDRPVGDKPAADKSVAAL